MTDPNDILEKHWKLYLSSRGRPYMELSEQAAEHLINAMEEFSMAELPSETIKTYINKVAKENNIDPEAVTLSVSGGKLQTGYWSGKRYHVLLKGEE